MSRPLALLALAALVAGRSPAADQAKIQEAIRKGADGLRRLHAPAQGYDGGGHGVGSAALAGLAMLEGGVKKDDPAIQHVAQYVRTEGLKEVTTYRCALGLVFLDRLGDPRDYGLIQVLGVRLYHGMNVNGGWTYNSWPGGTGGPAEEARLAAALYNTRPPAPGRLHPEAARLFAVVRGQLMASGRAGLSNGDDNSNTQFGLLGLWVAARHGVPVRDAVAMVELRFLRSQNPTDGGWGYNAGDPKSTATMTCAGLFALAAGAANREKLLTARPDRPKEEPPEPTPGAPKDPFANPRAAAPPADPKAEEKADPDALPADANKLPAGLRKGSVDAALTALGRVIAGAPLAGGGNAVLFKHVGHGNWYYLLWSIERAAVTLGLDTIGNVNWYDWGANLLLPAQTADTGLWDSEAYGLSVNTSFAILFLAKANLVADLSGKMKGKVKDPGKAELRGGGGPPLFAPARAAPEPPPAVVLPPVDATPDPGLPNVVDTADAARIATRVTAAKDEEWPDRLAEARDSRGVMNTLALARVIAASDGGRRKDARDALAERLARMTPKTLSALARDPDPEIRRAAVLAAAMKDAKAHIPDLIDRLTDPNDAVVRAARAGLKSLTGKDFGPEPGASDEAKLAAAAEWQRWNASRPR